MMKRNATGLSEAQLQGKDKIIKFGDYKYFIGGDSTLGNLITAGYIPDKQYKNTSRKPDGLIIKGKNTVIGVVEYKKPSAFKSDNQIQAAIDQALEVAEELDAKFIVATDGVNTSVWVNALTKERIVNSKDINIELLFTSDGNHLSKDIEEIVEKIDDKISKDNNRIGEIQYIDPTPLANKVWQRLYKDTQEKPEVCLYTFVEVFIFKYLSDLGVLRYPDNFEGCLINYKDNTKGMIEHYASIREKIKDMFPAGVDGTTIINGSIFVNDKDKAIIAHKDLFKEVLQMYEEFGELKNIDYDFKSKLFELFFKKDRDQGGLGQYFTPLKVVQEVVKMADIKEGMRICDPACGVGKFVLDAVKDVNRFYSVENGQLKSKITIEGYDKGFTTNHARTIILAKANMLIYFSELLKKNPDLTTQLAKLFNETFNIKATTLGTLDYLPTDSEKYDLILSNPPYMANGKDGLIREINKKGNEDLAKLYSVGGTGIESLFIVWIINALRENGTALIVLPDGVLSRDADKVIREYILRYCELNAIISLPENTFFSTSKKTYILSITKKNNINIEQTKPVFTYITSSIGETLDSYRFTTEDNDLSEAVSLYNSFKGSPNRKSQYEVDKRCKIIDFEEIKSNINNSWIIENWWTEEEKIDIGVKEKEDVINVIEYKELLDKAMDRISDYKKQIDIETFIENEEYTPLSLLGVVEIVGKSVGLNKSKLNAIETHNDEDIPVYTASRDVVAYIKEIDGKSPIFASEEQPVLSFGTNGDGCAGTNFIWHTRPFYIGSSRLPIMAKTNEYDLKYIYYQIKDMKKRYGFNYSKGATLNNLKAVEVNIPLDSNGKYDLLKQQAIAGQYEMIEQLKSKISEELSKLVNVVVEVE